jgi:hypothetical protein
MIDTRKDSPDANARWASQNAQIRHLMICIRVKEEKIQVLEDELLLLKAERQVEARQRKKDREALERLRLHDPWDMTVNLQEPRKPWYKRIFRKK